MYRLSCCKIPKESSKASLRYGFGHNVPWKNYRPKDPDFPLENIKGMEPGMLPPYQDVLNQKMKRCNFVSYMWKHAHLKDPMKDIQARDHGYKEENEIISIKCYVGSQLPSNIAGTIAAENIENTHDDNESFDEEVDSCDYSSEEEEEEVHM